MTTGDRIESLLSVYLAARGTAQPLDPVELCRDCPELLTELREQIAVADAMDRLANPPAFPLDPTHIVPPAADAADSYPSRLGEYVVVRKLGHGGMGVVLLAKDEALEREVAIKVMKPELAANSIARNRFLREAQAAAAVHHDHVVNIHRVGEDEGIPYLVMELLVGESLEDRLKRDGAIPPSEVARIGRETALGLAAAHDTGRVHRDVKPGNLWLEAPTERVKVLDFGLARAVDESPELSQWRGVLGTPGYMAPEQIDGTELDTRADLFGLGCVLYRAATGFPAFGGDTRTAILRATAQDHPKPPHERNPLVPIPLSDLILRLLAKTPADRPESAREVAEQLRHLHHDQDNRNGRNRRWAVPIVAFVLIGWIGCVVTRPDPVASPPSSAPSLGPSKSELEPLHVSTIEVQHFTPIPGGDKPQGLLGLKAFAPALGDKIQFIAKLSRPAYAYLLAYRPDGVVDLCFPTDQNTPPPLTDTPRYPPLTNPDDSYGLKEGTGLWVVAVVASEKPLPPYGEWLQRHPEHATAWKVLANPPKGVVWCDDGDAWVETRTAMSEVRLPRGKGEKLDGPASLLRRLTDSLRNAGQAQTAAVIGFGVN